MHCEHCKFWVTADPLGVPKRIGECRRFPPQVISRAKRYYDPKLNETREHVLPVTQARWPGVSSTDWCGEFQSRP